MTNYLGNHEKTITVTVLDGNGMPKDVTVVVSENATEKEIEEALERKIHGE